MLIEGLAKELKGLPLFCIVPLHPLVQQRGKGTRIGPAANGPVWSPVDAIRVEFACVWHPFLHDSNAKRLQACALALGYEA